MRKKGLRIDINKSENVTKNLFEDAEEIVILNNSYLFSYPHIKRYFGDIKGEITEYDLIIGIHLVYGWMPTIFEFKNGKTVKNSIFEDKIIKRNITEVVGIVNKIKFKSYNLIDSDYILMKKLFNNSLVGTSKLLHFIDPNKFAIWDSNVFLYLNNEFTNRPDSKYRPYIETPENFISYLNYLKELSQHKEFCSLKKKVKDELKQFGYEDEISDFRVLELVMFTLGKDLKSNGNC